ncbi:hypothetical protein N7474_009438 [Penicillium riverlandense]|uniref:uncharacterized protein n=1 Tax=Penicillium riverlandense TaxID=1903569 RepID=UPI002546EC98|nr:uncharacterized protein N7474_009438 [Penicillium riverlandense]KAJ5808169.1 hypothetical protein N7474_009438 [Penicillium riverlandense]
MSDEDVYEVHDRKKRKTRQDGLQGEFLASEETAVLPSAGGVALDLSQSWEFGQYEQCEWHIFAQAGKRQAKPHVNANSVMSRWQLYG